MRKRADTALPIPYQANFQAHSQMPGSIVNCKQLIWGFSALCLGLFEYLVDRPANSTHLSHLIQAAGFPQIAGHGFFGRLGGVLPDFVHPFSFSLISMALFPLATKRFRAGICLFWMTINLMFEMGQGIGRQVAETIIQVVSNNNFSAPLAGYFAKGTFDPMDLAAISVGAWVAHLVGGLTSATSSGGKGHGTATETKMGKGNRNKTRILLASG